MAREATAIVLAGGSSRRMGRDKSRIVLGGLPMLERVLRPASAVCNEVIVAGGVPFAGGGRTVSWVEDPPGPAGPLAGLVAGLRAASNERCLLAACDMPFLHEGLLAHLVDALDGYDAVVPRAGGSPQPLHAVYARAALPSVESLLGGPSGSSMLALLSRLRVRYLSESECLRLDPEGLSWFNLNRPGDLQAARRHLARGRPRVLA